MIHYPTVAGMFYPADPKELQQMLADFFLAAAVNANLPIPKAIIAPHAGYIYSGPIAASVYACLAHTSQITRVVLLAPAHREYFDGIAATSYDFYKTPLGRIRIDKDVINTLSTLPFVRVFEQIYSGEHSAEVQLPFLQTVLPKFSLVPLLVGDVLSEKVAVLLEKLWGGDETLIVVSSDLSHYHEYAAAQKIDQSTAASIVNLNWQMINSEYACGFIPIRGLLQVAAKKGLRARLIDLRNSGDTAGPKDGVVGYGAFHFG